MDRYTVGIIARPHGVRGAVKVNPLTDDVSRFKDLKKVFIDNKEFTITNTQVSKTEVYLTFENISDRDKAEALKNKEIQVNKEDAVKLPEDSYFIVDIVGCEVFVDNNSIGSVVDVLQYGAADVYVIEKKNKQIMVPAIKALLENVDTENKKIILNPKVFKEVAVYED